MTTDAGIPPFANHLPVRIQFGDGVSGRLRDVAEQESATRVVAVIDAGLEQANPAVAAAIARLESGVERLIRVQKTPGEPSDIVVDATAEKIAEARADAIVAIGGGSVIDTAKAARLCAQQAMPYTRLIESLSAFPAPTVPLIAVPTTAGTGSEVSGGAVITDHLTSRKAGIAHSNLRPQHALVDPVLTHSVPPAMTAFTGIDALAQAIAGMVAKVRTPIGDAIALEAIRLIGRSLAPAYADGSDAAARSEVACGSLMAGLTMNISDCTAEHSLGQAIGGEFHAPHGLTIGVVLAETLERERHVVPAQLERVADALGAPDDGSGDGSRAVTAIRDLLARLEFPVLSSLGVEESHLDHLTELTEADFFITQAPKPWSAAEIRAALQSALEMTDRQRALA
jgi:alcohol dehydrogenase